MIMASKKQTVLAVRGMVDVVTLFFQPFHQVGGDLGIVFDYEHTH